MFHKGLTQEGFLERGDGGMACVGTRGSAGLSGGLVLVLGGRAEIPSGQAQGPRIHNPTSPCPYAQTSYPPFPILD